MPQYGVTPVPMSSCWCCLHPSTDESLTHTTDFLKFASLGLLDDPGTISTGFAHLPRLSTLHCLVRDTAVTPRHQNRPGLACLPVVLFASLPSLSPPSIQCPSWYKLGPPHLRTLWCLLLSFSIFTIPVPLLLSPSVPSVRTLASGQSCSRLSTRLRRNIVARCSSWTIARRSTLDRRQTTFFPFFLKFLVARVNKSWLSIIFQPSSR